MGKSYGVAYLYFFRCVCGPQSDRILVLFEVRAVESFGTGQFIVSSVSIFERVNGRIVINLCLSIEIAEAEDEKFGVVDAVEFSPERLDFGID